ncbi:hypothetical protein TEA_008631 [Camellia sinensis var. sinensis]|uniref:HAUS augmin-like complex subunit 3 N-terminal domain-containing protein n=1 Tax=Camellia sinensis var. sinensis TaxID=542762 RepID=A0A4S4EKN7_CAMSN|nr:hypothetical protein TEA_008631 [Camellia sinensis var. sinensis]
MSGARLCALLGDLGFQGHDTLDPDSFEWPFQYDDARPILDWLCSSLRPSNVLSLSDLYQLSLCLSLSLSLSIYIYNCQKDSIQLPNYVKIADQYVLSFHLFYFTSLPNNVRYEQFLQEGKLLEGEDLDFAYDSISAFSTRRDNQEAVFGAEEGLKDIRKPKIPLGHFVEHHVCNNDGHDIHAEMRLLTHNMLSSNIKGVTNSFPLRIEVLFLVFRRIPRSLSSLQQHLWSWRSYQLALLLPQLHDRVTTTCSFPHLDCFILSSISAAATSAPP